MDARLEGQEFVAGTTFSVADITALVTLDFAARALHIEPDEALPHARRWYQAVSARPSATA
ncbi:MAG: glutathione binding-like protein [Arhodomonas sp.]|nr:glutathione binding-like protein [Arhodomonas sp.]